jgi:hypothetical protein
MRRSRVEERREFIHASQGRRREHRDIYYSFSDISRLASLFWMLRDIYGFFSMEDIYGFFSMKETGFLFGLSFGNDKTPYICNKQFLGDGERASKPAMSLSHGSFW